MSTTIGLYGASGTSYILQQAIDQLTDQQNVLAGETSTGVKSTSYAGLGDSRSAALSLQPQITAVTTWQAGVTSAQTKLSVTQVALKQITDIASSLQASLLSLGGSLGQGQIDTIAATAKTQLAQLGTLLNTTSGTGYVFAGSDATEPPISDPSGLLDSSLSTVTSALISDSSLSSLGAEGVMEQATAYATHYTTDATDAGLYSVFSDSVNVDGSAAKLLQNTSVIGQSTFMQVGMVATETTQGAAASSTSTGSPIRDLMRNLMMVASLGSVSTSSSQFSDLVSALSTSTTAVTSQLTDEQAALGVQQNSLTSQASLLTTMSTMLSTQLSTATSADIAAVSVQTSAIKDQLEASYTLVANMKGMTLASYI